MSTELERLRAALLAEAPEPGPALAARVLGRRPEPTQRGRRVAALAAALLAMVLVGALLVAGNRLALPWVGGGAVPGARTPEPVSPRAPSPSPTPRVPAQYLTAAHLENVSALVQPLNAVPDSGEQARLIGVYSDAARTVFLLSGVTGGAGGSSVTDGQGLLNAYTTGRPVGTEGSIFAVEAGLRAGPDGTTPVTLDASAPTGRWTFHVTVRVGGGTALPALAPAVVGGWHWQLTATETPNAIRVVAIVQGATVDEVTASREPLTLAGPTGAAALVLSEGAHITVPKQQINATTIRTTEVDATWLRGADGTYQLTIHTPTEQRTIDLVVG
jgi:hypothetical protein